MSKRPHDLDPGEQRFLQQRGCPPYDQLLAARADVLPEAEAGPILSHLDGCGACQTLLADLMSAELASPSEAELGRIRSRMDAQLQPAKKPLAWLRWQVWAPAAAAMAGILFAIYVNKAPQVHNKTEVAERRDDAPQRAHLPLQKPPLKLPLAAAITWRGAEGGKPEEYLKQLGVAMAPYRADDFVGSTRPLRELAEAYPQAVEPHFYLGVCLLYQNQPQQALTALFAARRRDPDALKDDVEWYVGVAWERTGNRKEAMAALQPLCERTGAYQERACSAVAQLR
jgi:tetratricopeptide (TPR) repeat protein